MIKNFIAKLKSRRKSASELLPQGFHGDKKLLEIIDQIAKDRKFFIETGTNAGSTLKYMANNYPKLKCYSCEPHPKTYELAKSNVKECRNVNLLNKDSITFLKDLDKSILKEPTLFWLDAHGYGFTWPLKFEVEFILSHVENAFILIDDFKVPHIPEFLFDEYKGQSCTFEYIKDSIPNVKYELYYPNYKEKTSEFHPLKGWCMFTKGTDLPDSINSHDIINAKLISLG